METKYTTARIQELVQQISKTRKLAEKKSLVARHFELIEKYTDEYVPACAAMYAWDYCIRQEENKLAVRYLNTKASRATRNLTSLGTTKNSPRPVTEASKVQSFQEWTDGIIQRLGGPTREEDLPV